ncbi:MAG: flagellar hook basal-body protein [Phycisphaerales bacterium]|nr:flagellar hook basal-body protein [Phycisphaerales bacterium]
MNYGVQLSASGVLTSLYRQDVLTNNLANMDSVGYKPDITATRQRDAARIEDGLSYMPSDALLEQLGAGALMAPNLTDFEQGGLEVTNQPLDVAVRGEGFLVVRDETDTGKDKLRLTRDGRLSLDSRGRLVMASTGMPVMDPGGRTIQLTPGRPVKIDGDGQISQDGRAVARIHLLNPADPSRMTKQGHSLFRAPAETFSSKAAASGQIQQGSLERSAVDEIRTIMQITAAGRDVDANMSLIAQHDRLTDRAINTLGRVS